MARPIPLIRASGAAAFSKPLAELGVPIDRLWGRAGIAPDVLDDGDRLIPLQALVEFAEEAACDQGILDLGLRVAERTPFESLGVFGALTRSQPTLKKAIETAIALVASYDSGERVWTVHERDGVRIRRRVRVADERFRQADLFTFGLIVNLVRVAAGPQWRPTYSELQSPGPFTSQSEMVSGAEIETGRPATGVFVPRELLHLPMAPFSAMAVSNGGPLGAWGGSEKMRDFVPSVREAVAVFLESDGASVAAVSRAAGMSTRSLQRGLSAVGTSYAAVVDNVRMERAMELVRDPGVRIIDVALSLGYSDQAHFTRAFRRWTSISPAQYRRGLLAVESASDLSA